MRIVCKFLMFTVVFGMVIVSTVLLFQGYFLEKQLEKAILEGYPGTGKIEVDINMGLFKGKIDNLKIIIYDWQLGKWQINEFRGEFENVKINWTQLLQKKTLVIEKINKGDVVAIIDNDNLNEGIKNYYHGFNAKIIDNELAVTLTVNILGKKLKATAYGCLLPAKGPAISFQPKGLKFARYKFAGSIQQEIINKIKIKLELEKTPFPFQVTTVKIMQDKIIIKGDIEYKSEIV